nr:RNA-directed DNA polymerase, eukaryota [Tanacetum cinerariifolium]
MSGAQSTINSKFKNLHDVTATVYVTNFSTSLGTKDLWKLCDKCGTVVDVYIAPKLSKNGRRFAFFRFLKVKNKESLIEDLKKIWIGSYHIFAAMARFEKKSHTYTKTNLIRKPPNNHSKNTSPSIQVNPNRSYANALNGNSFSSPETQPKTILKSITLNESDLVDTSDMRNVILAKVRDVHLILNINNVLNKEGFSNFHCKYIGVVKPSPPPSLTPKPMKKQIPAIPRNFNGCDHDPKSHSNELRAKIKILALYTQK